MMMIAEIGMNITIGATAIALIVGAIGSRVISNGNGKKGVTKELCDERSGNMLSHLTRIESKLDELLVARGGG